MAGYNRNDTTNNIATGNIINASDLDGEFDAIDAAFDETTGHVHDGTSGNGAPITKVGPVQDLVVSASTVTPKTTATLDLGTPSLKFKDLNLSGNALVAGTLGVTGNTTLAGALISDNITDSTSTITGAVQTDGGLGVAKALWVGGLANIAGATTLQGTLGVTGVATLTAKPILSSLTASQAVFSDATKGLVSNAITGTGNVVMSASPTLTGTAAGASLSLSSLTSGRVTYAGTAGLLQDSANLTFNGTTLTAAGFSGPLTGAVTGNASTATALQTARTIFGQSFDGTANVTGSVTSSALTSGRVTYAGTGGLLQDDADLTFDGSTLTTLNAAYTGTLTGGTGVVNLGSGQFYKDASGNVGINYTSPFSKLEVYGTTGIISSTTGEATGVGTIRITSGSSALSSDGGLEFKIAGDSNGYGSKIQALNSGGSQLVFANRQGSATWTERMRIDSSGNVGIGTSSPTTKLLINSGTTGVHAATFYSNGATSTTGFNAYGITLTGNLSNGNAECNVVYGSAGGGLAFNSWNGVTQTERMRIDSSGNVGIGTSSPARLFQVSNSANAIISVINDGVEGAFNTDGSVVNLGSISSVPLTFETGGAERMRILNTGQVVFGKTVPSLETAGTAIFATGYVSCSLVGSTSATDTLNVFSIDAANYRFYVDMGGTIHATSIVISAISDERLKENIKDIDTGLDSIMALKPRRFDWKEGKGQNKKNAAGFIAQEFETVFPESVGLSKAGGDGIEYKNINHETLIPTLVKAIQELKAEVDSLKQQLGK